MQEEASTKEARAENEQNGSAAVGVERGLVVFLGGVFKRLLVPLSTGLLVCIDCLCS